MSENLQLKNIGGHKIFIPVGYRVLEQHERAQQGDLHYIPHRETFELIVSDTFIGNKAGNLICVIRRTEKEIREDERNHILEMVDENVVADTWLYQQTSIGIDEHKQFLFSPTTIAERNGIVRGISIYRDAIKARTENELKGRE